MTKSKKKLAKAAKKAVVAMVMEKPKNKKAKSKTKKYSSLMNRGGRFGDIGTKRFLSAPQVKDYVKCLTDPFFAPAPKLGFDTFIPTTKHSTWYEASTLAPPATVTGCVIICQPATASSVFQAPFTPAQYNTAISTITYSTSSMANSASIVSLAQTGRVINWALRVKVRSAGTALPGTVGFLFVPKESRTNIASLSPANLVQLAGYRACNTEVPGCCGGEVQYRPSDSDDFVFYSYPVVSGGWTTTTTTANMICVINGWSATNWDAEISVIGHIETLAGVDTSGDTDNEPDLVDGGMTIDKAASAIASAGEPIVTSIKALEALDSANSNISRNRKMRSFSGVIGNLVTAGNSIFKTVRKERIQEESKEDSDNEVIIDIIKTSTKKKKLLEQE